MHQLNIRLVVLFLVVCTGSGDICPDEQELKQIIDGFVVEASLESLEGVWMDVYLDSKDVRDLDSSYSENKLDPSHSYIDIKAKEIQKGSGKETTYAEKISKKENLPKGVFSWTGKYDDDTDFERIIYMFYADANAIGYYSCDTQQTLKDGWDVLVAVNSKKRKELLEATTTPNSVQTSKNKAVEKLLEIRARNKEFRKTHNGHFGLMGRVREADLSKLRPVEN